MKGQLANRAKNQRPPSAPKRPSPPAPGRRRGYLPVFRRSVHCDETRSTQAARFFDPS